MKKFVSGAIIGALLVSSVSAIAATGTKMMTAHYTINKLIVDGVDTGKGNAAFVSEGTTYVPLRTVSDALGNSISYDKNTRNIYINTGSSANGSTPTDLPVTNGGTVNQPVVNQPIVSQPATGKYISQQQAKNAAVKAVGGGSVIFIKSDFYDERPDYDVKVMFNGRIYEVEIDAYTGIVKDFDIDD